MWKYTRTIGDKIVRMSDQNELTDPSPRTEAYVKRALEAFEIPLSSIKIYGFKKTGDVVSGGTANSISRIITMNETNSDLESLYTSFHEAAHIKDDINNKISMYAKWLTAAAATTYLPVLPALMSRLENRITSRLWIPISTAIGAAYGVSFVSLGIWFHDNVAAPWAREQSEYRADKMAVEKLLSLGELDPILHELISKSILAESHGQARILGHPSANSEYKAMKRTLQNHGYEVARSRCGGERDTLKISVTRDGNGREAEFSLGAKL